MPSLSSPALPLSPSLTRLEKVSVRLSWTSRAFALAVLVLPAMIWIAVPHYLPPIALGPSLAEGFQNGQTTLSAGSASFSVRLACAAAGVFFDLPLIFALWTLGSLFAAFGRGSIFGPFTPIAFRRMGQALILWAISRLFNNTAIVLFLTLANPPGQRQLQIGIGDGDVTALFVGIVVWVLAWVFEEARRLQEDNEQIV